MTDGHRLGEWGERAARLFLEGCGFRCLEQRYRRPGGEIDLICRRGDTLIFVEVKTRGPGNCAPPEAFVDRRKLGRMRRLAGAWLAEHPGSGAAVCRLDVVAVEFAGPGRGCRIRHLAGVG